MYLIKNLAPEEQNISKKKKIIKNGPGGAEQKEKAIRNNEVRTATILIFFGGDDLPRFLPLLQNCLAHPDKDSSKCGKPQPLF